MLKTATSAFVGDPELIECLETRATPVRCDNDQILFRQGEEAVGLFIVKRGEATLEMQSTAGDGVMSLHAGPGSLLGLPGVLGNVPYTLTASAQAGAELSLFLARHFRNCWHLSLVCH